MFARPAIVSSSAARRRPATITVLPASCRCCASAAPIPDPPPVTRIVLPLVFIRRSPLATPNARSPSSPRPDVLLLPTSRSIGLDTGQEKEQRWPPPPTK
ncbi:hypothetical protein AB5I41_01935 [Sphingomonas sp. MMS24-JH45]